VRLTLTLGPDGLVRLQHDAGETITVLLAERDLDGNYAAAGSDPVKAVATNTETTIARVVPATRYGHQIVRLESEP
jgi:fructose-1,6-bisphosphatase/inositol monophosphatase family enzyme